MKKKLCCLVLVISATIFFLTGCKDMVEIEDRDFVLAFGVLVENNNFKLMYARPDLAALTGQSAKEGESFILTVTADSIAKAEAKYSLEANKRLDYSHLKVILLDKSLIKDEQKMIEFLSCIENNYEISKNTLVFMTLDGVDKVLEMNKTISGSIGEYLESLNKNNLSRKGEENRTIADLINSKNSKNEIAVVPIVELRENRIGINGVGLFYNNVFKDKISADDYIYLDIANGHGEDSNIKIPSAYYLKLKQVKRNCSFSTREGKPYLLFQISGNAIAVEGSDMTDPNYIDKNKDILERELNSFVKAKLIDNFNTLMKEEKIDFLNLYRLTSSKNRKIWMAYKDKQTEFINDLEIGVVVNLKIK